MLQDISLPNILTAEVIWCLINISWESDEEILTLIISKGGLDNLIDLFKSNAGVELRALALRCIGHFINENRIRKNVFITMDLLKDIICFSDFLP